MAEVPLNVRALVQEREQARAAKDFTLADKLREKIADFGYDVLDGAAGSTLTPRAATGAALPRLRLEEVEDISEQESLFDVSVQWVAEGWPHDVLRGIKAFRANAGTSTVQCVVVDCLEDTEPVAWPEDVDVVSLRRDTGWAKARNAGLRRNRGSVVIIVDGSIEPTADVCTPVREALREASVGVTGPFGIVTSDLRDFVATDGPQADAIEGYLMAFRADTVRAAGGFDEKFMFYRTADIEYSFRVKDLGLRATVTALPVIKHEHRMWHSTSEAERERLSRKNFNRFLERWRGRFDLTVARQGGEEPDDQT